MKLVAKVYIKQVVYILLLIARFLMADRFI